MSHTSTIDSVTIQDIEALRAAVLELSQKGVNCELVENQTPRAYYNNQQGMGQADFVLKLNDAQYDVGFYKREDNTYEARTDFWGGSVERQLGTTNVADGENREQARMGKLYQMYSVHAATRSAIQQGYSVSRNEQADGTIQLVVNV